MPFIRLIIIYIIVIVAVIALFNRDKVMELTGLSPNMFWAQDDADDTPQEEQGEEAAATPAVEADVSDSKPQEDASDAVAKAEATPAPEAKAAAEVAPEAEPTPAPEAVAPPANEPAQTEAQAQPVQTEEQPAASEVAAAPQAPAEPVAEPVEKPAVEPDEKPTAPAPQQDAKAAIEKALNAARQSYRSGKVQQSEARYVALGDQFPDSADVQGEIGNFYYAQRQYQNAATYYYKTGKALLKSGDQAKLGQIINILQQLAPNMAADLRAQAAN